MSHLHPLSPGSSPDLSDPAAAAPPGLPRDPRASLPPLLERLDELQTALYAEARRAVLVILQGRDASGKDGLIRNVFGRMDPLGVRATSFRAPTALELRHDFLWRIHREAPAAGTIGVFNRSHYEDVVVVRVNRLVPEATWRARFDQIVGFERLLAASGTTVVKFLLHVSRDEQRKRLLKRLDRPEKRWKFDPSDVEARERWDAYTDAYDEALRRTATPEAPWYVVPADDKGARDLLVASTLVGVLERMRPRYPEPALDYDQLRRRLQ